MGISCTNFGIFMYIFQGKNCRFLRLFVSKSTRLARVQAVAGLPSDLSTTSNVTHNGPMKECAIKLSLTQVWTLSRNGANDGENKNRNNPNPQ